MNIELPKVCDFILEMKVRLSPYSFKGVVLTTLFAEISDYVQ